MNSCPIMARRSRRLLVALLPALAPLAMILVGSTAHSADCTPYGKYFHWIGSMVDPVHGEILRETPSVSWPLAAGLTEHGTRVVLYDISDPERIKFRGVAEEGIRPFAVAIEQDLLAVWIRDFIRIYHIASPQTPILLAEIPYPEKALCCSGTLDLIDGLLYTTGRGGSTNFDPIAVFDLTDPDSPVLLAELQVPSSDHGIVVHDGFAYLASERRGIGIVDLRVRSQPTFLGFFQSARVESVNDIAFVSDHLVVLERHLATELVTYDLSTPGEPVEIHRTADPTINTGLCISGSKDLLLVETVSPQLDPLPALYRMDAEGELSLFQELPRRIDRYSTITGNTLFSGSQIAPLDRLEPAPFAAQLPKGVHDIEARGDEAFCLSHLTEGGYGIAAYSFRSPRIPQVVDELPINDSVTGLAIAGSRLYGQSERRVHAVDVSNPKQMHLVTSLTLSTDPFFFLQGIAAHDGLVGVTSHIHNTTTGALHVLAVGTGGSLHEVGRVDGNWSGDPKFLDGETLVAVLDEHPALIDLSDPSTPQVVDVHPELTRTNNFAVQGSIVLASRYRVTSILERTGKSTLEVIGHIGISAEDIAIRDHRAYFASIQILDISDPRNPRLAGDVLFPEIPGTGNGAIAVTDQAIVASGLSRGLMSAFLPCIPRPDFNEAALIDDEDNLVGDIRDSESGSLVVESLSLQLEPNPFRNSLQLNLTGPLDTRVQVGIYDVTGRHIRTMESSMGSSSAHTMIWDGRDSAGRDVGAGVYLLRLQSEAGDVLRRVVKLR